MTAERVLTAIDIYANGGTVAEAIAAVKMTARDFYKIKRGNALIAERYEEVKRDRADKCLDEIYGIAQEIRTGLRTDSRGARVEAEILRSLAEKHDPQKFGNKLTLEHEAGPNILGAMADAARRMPPGRDLAPMIEAEYTTVPTLSALDATDKQSAEPQKPSSTPANDDPFVD